MALAPPYVEAIALVSSANQRIYLNARSAHTQSQSDDAAQKKRNDLLRLEYAAHCALDVVDERTQSKGANGEVVTNAVSFLGLVLTLEDLAIYALVTSTRLRILLLISPGEGKVRDLDCLTILRAVHTCYLSHIGNPFHALATPQANQTPHMHLGQSNAQLDIKSALFDKRIRAIGGW